MVNPPERVGINLRRRNWDFIRKIIYERMWERQNSMKLWRKVLHLACSQSFSCFTARKTARRTGGISGEPFLREKVFFLVD